MDLVYARNRRLIAGQPVESFFLHLNVTSTFLFILSISLAPILILAGYTFYLAILQLQLLLGLSEQPWVPAAATITSLLGNLTAGFFDNAFEIF